MTLQSVPSVQAEDVQIPLLLNNDEIRQIEPAAAAPVGMSDFISAKSGAISDIYFDKDYVDRADMYAAGIANDVSKYQKLLIVGNKTSGKRTVGILDDLYGYGNMHADGDLTANSAEFAKIRAAEMQAEQLALKSLQVTGDGKFTGDLYAGGKLDVHDLHSLTGEFDSLIASDVMFNREFDNANSKAQITNDVTKQALVISGIGLDANRAINMRGNLRLDGEQNVIFGSLKTMGALDSDGGVNTNGALAVGKDANLHGAVTIDGDANLRGEVSMGKNLSLGGRLHVEKDVDIGGPVSVWNDMGVGGNLLAKGLTINGDAAIAQNASIKGALNVGGVIQAASNVQVGGDLKAAGKLVAQNFGEFQTTKVQVSGTFQLTENTMMWQNIGNWCLVDISIAWTGTPAGDYPFFAMPFALPEQIVKCEAGSAVDALIMFKYNTTVCYFNTAWAGWMGANGHVKYRGLLRRS